MAELEKSFKAFFHNFHPKLSIFAEHYVKDSDAANDIVQDSFIKLWHSQTKFDDVKAKKTFLYTITKNSCLNFIKRKKIEHQYQSELLKTESFFRDLVVEQETFTLIQSAITELPKQAKKVIEFSLNGLKNPEIALRMNISVNTVKSLKANGYRHLRHSLKENVV